MANDTDEPKTLEHLSNEIFYLIFDFLSGDDVLNSFGHVNGRFNALVKNFRLKTIKLSGLSFNKIVDFFKNFSNELSISCNSMKLTNEIPFPGSCSASIEFIFSSVLDPSQLKNLISNLQQLILVRPIIDTKICLPDYLLRSFVVYPSTNKIIFRKNRSQRHMNDITLCSDDTMRSLLVDYGGIYDQMLINFQNSLTKTIIPSVQHLKLYIDDYKQQANHMAEFIVGTLSELTVIVTDEEFPSFDGTSFSSLVSAISDSCRLHFYLQVSAHLYTMRRDVDALLQSFQSSFYVNHGANVSIAFTEDFYRRHDSQLLIHTTPYCVYKLLLTNQHVIGAPVDYANITRLVFDPCSPHNVPTLAVNNPINNFNQLVSLEFLHIHSYNNYLRINPFDNFNDGFQRIIQNIRHLHIQYAERVSCLINVILKSYRFLSLYSLDITDSSFGSSILHDIISNSNFCINIRHLNILGYTNLSDCVIKEVHLHFLSLQTLRFSKNLNPSFQEELNTIAQYILCDMSSHLRYLQVKFLEKNSPITSMIPSENQLSEWLGDNQQRLMHVQVIELNRDGLRAWM